MDPNAAFPEFQIGLGTTRQQALISLKGTAVFTVAPNSLGVSTCYSTFKESPSLASTRLWILGEPIYRVVEINHDFDNQRMGFASLQNTLSTVVVGSSVPVASGASMLGFKMLLVGVLAALASW